MKLTNLLLCAAFASLALAGCAGETGPSEEDLDADMIQDTADVEDAVSCSTQETACDGVCVDTGSDPTNCGACGVSCTEDELCMDGVCEPDCPSTQRACGGACVDVLASLDHCGTCDRACDEGETCKLGLCTSTCPVGQELCGSVCVDLLDDERHCGACGVQCGEGEYCIGGLCACGADQRPDQGPVCGSGRLCCGSPLPDAADDDALQCRDALDPKCYCGGDQCAGGQLCCDDACADPFNDPSHCGGCDLACSAGEVCVDGACTTECPTDQVRCLDRCFDPETNNAHCGGCGIACEPGEQCSNGACVLSCSLSQVECDEECVSIRTDRRHCGGCGQACGQGEVCVDGLCADSCLPGQTLCTDACVTLVSSPYHCGECNNRCDQGEVCVEGLCELQCPTGQTECGNFCVTTQSDVFNCGGCGLTCNAGERCVAGACALVCAPGQTLCGAECVNLRTDRAHCGACGDACLAGEVCAAGVCEVSCPGAQVVCDGACADLQTDRAHCGACGDACLAGEVCVAGACEVSCPGAQTVCDGACTDLQTDALHCGACGDPCGPSEACVAGACETTCAPGQTLCAGACVNTSYDPEHCGACDNPCDYANATGVCIAGACDLNACAPGFDDCDGDPGNGCEADLAVDMNHCGVCGDACEGFLLCESGACVLGPVASYYIEAVDTTDCSLFEHVGSTGDDRGGLAVSFSDFWVTGDQQTAIYDLSATTQAGAVTLGQPFDGILSDLGTGQVYSLSVDGVAPFDRNATSTPYVFTHLLSLDAAGQVTAAVALSEPLTANNGGNLMLAGLGELGFYNESAQTVSLIDPATGTVTLLNPSVNLDVYGSESWADWGIIETWNDERFALYRSSDYDEGLSRARLADGAPGPQLALGADLSDLSSHTLSLANNRLYFHYESYADAFSFGGDETAGSCAVTFGAGLCGPASSGLTDCSGTCAYLDSDEAHCGACGVACAAGEFCVESACSPCPNPGEELCAGACIDASSDPNNCGACGTVCPAAEPYCSSSICTDLYVFSGIQTNLPEADLAGWSVCYSSTYDTSTSLSQIQSQCAGANLLLACRPVGSTTLQVAAHAPRADVFFDTGTGQTSTHEANGVAWYYNGSYSWGFAPVGEPVSRNSCDTASTLPEQRICWHTSGGNISNGWRCGANTGLGNNTWERIIYQSP